jgi:hypothetical protein
MMKKKPIGLARGTSGPNDLLSVKLKKGTMLITWKVGEEKTYLVRNRDQKKKVVLAEHPYRSDWELVEPKESTEGTRGVYRFLVNVDSDKTQKLTVRTVREQKQLSETMELVSTGPAETAY